MPDIDLAQLAALVGGGVGLVLLTIHLTGGSMGTTLTDADEVRRIWALDSAEAIRSVQVSDDRTAALVALDGRRYGVVFALGDRWVIRVIPESAHIRQRRDRVVVAFGDLTTAPVRIRLADAEVRDAWVRRLEV